MWQGRFVVRELKMHVVCLDEWRVRAPLPLVEYRLAANRCPSLKELNVDGSR